MQMTIENNQAHKTAISRSAPSMPMRVLRERKLIRGRVLDYGCGKGYDADTFGYDKYDPHFAPQEPTGKYDTITCIYVLNVLHPNEGDLVLAKIKQLLADGGIAYLAVRRDIKIEGKTSKGTFQRNVLLPLPIIHEDSGCCIYKLKKE